MKQIAFLLIIYITLGCNRSVNKTNVTRYIYMQVRDTLTISHNPTTNQRQSKYIDRDSLIIPHDLKTFSRDSEDTYWIPKDTTTVHKNFIKYLITNDSCCSDNIYLNWGNDSINRIEIAQYVRQCRSYFTPYLVHETSEYLILEHGCATDCSAVLFLPLNNSEKVKSFLDIIDYNPGNYTVIKAIDNNLEENEHEFIEAVNAKTNKTKRIIFKNSGLAARLIFLVDSCNISDDEIYIRANLYDKQKDKKVVEELRLRNDIKK
jgi:hypothetical protein